MKTPSMPFGSFVFRTPLFPFNVPDGQAAMDPDVFREAISLTSLELSTGNVSSALENGKNSGND